MAQVLPLEYLTVGQTGQITDIDGQPELVCRLNEIGVSVGKLLRIVRSGSPCIVAIGEQRLSFRGEQAAAIFVECR